MASNQRVNTMYEWSPNQSNIAVFVLVDANGEAVSGLGSNFTVKVGNGLSPLVESSGTRGELAGGAGWYYVQFPASECQRGLIPIQINAPGVVQQNLLAVCGKGISPLSVQYQHTVLLDGIPLGDVTVWVSTDMNGVNLVASGITDAFGHVTFLLDPGVYYAFCRKYGVNFVNPTQFTVS